MNNGQVLYDSVHLYLQSAFSDKFYATMTLNFDPMTPKSEALISVRKCLEASNPLYIKNNSTVDPLNT